MLGYWTENQLWYPRLVLQQHGKCIQLDLYISEESHVCALSLWMQLIEMDCPGLLVETPCVTSHNSYVRLAAAAGKEKTNDTHSLLLASIALGPAKDRAAGFYSDECNWESMRSSGQWYRINLYDVISHGACSSCSVIREPLQALESTGIASLFSLG